MKKAFGCSLTEEELGCVVEDLTDAENGPAPRTIDPSLSAGLGGRVRGGRLTGRGDGGHRVTVKTMAG